jgi:NADPH:quinone reductase-like Zn-dependent oxidoreductase
MRAITQDTYGSADVLQPTDLPRPAIAADEVLVQVAAAGLDRGTWHIMHGKPYLARLALGLRRPKARVPGLDLVGTIAEVGPSVAGWSVGDEVYGIGKGSFAEYAAADPAKLSRRPSGLTDEQAAIVPVSGLTAWQAVTRAGQVEAGQQVLVTGASGGVGTYAVQVAVALGAEVTAVCSAAKADLVRSLGARHVLDYAVDDLAGGSRRYDVIIDIAGNTPLKRLRRALTPQGRAVIVGGEAGTAVVGGLGRPIWGALTSPLRRQKVVMFMARETGADLAPITDLIESGQVRPTLDRVFPLDEAAEAMAHLESGRTRGKIAIAVRPATA